MVKQCLGYLVAVRKPPYSILNAFEMALWFRRTEPTSPSLRISSLFVRTDFIVSADPWKISGERVPRCMCLALCGSPTFLLPGFFLSIQYRFNSTVVERFWKCKGEGSLNRQDYHSIANNCLRYFTCSRFLQHEFDWFCTVCLNHLKWNMGVIGRDWEKQKRVETFYFRYWIFGCFPLFSLFKLLRLVQFRPATCWRVAGNHRIRSPNKMAGGLKDPESMGQVESRV